MGHVLLIDNYDSFTWNVYQLLAEIGADVSVVRNDEITVDRIAAAPPDHIVLSPGPGRPEDAGVTCDVVTSLAGVVPILGICLGHQCIAHGFAARVDRIDLPLHGKTSPILHDGRGVFAGLAASFSGTRYHSLAVNRDSIPEELEVSAVTPDGIVMGVRHRTHQIHGVQFHPESIASQLGRELFTNFLSTAEGHTS